VFFVFFFFFLRAEGCMRVGCVGGVEVCALAIVGVGGGVCGWVCVCVCVFERGRAA